MASKTRLVTRTHVGDGRYKCTRRYLIVKAVQRKCINCGKPFKSKGFRYCVRCKAAWEWIDCSVVHRASNPWKGVGHG